MVFAIICTYTLQFYVPVAILWPSVQEKYGPFQSPALAEYLLRAVLVFATCNVNIYNIDVLKCYFTRFQLIISFGSFGGRGDTSSGLVHITGRRNRQHVLSTDIPAHMSYGRLEGRRIRRVQLETPHGYHYHSLGSARVRYWYILQFIRHCHRV